MKGRIIRGIAGFYYVVPEGRETVYECRAKGIFRKDKSKPLPGDYVEMEELPEEEENGYPHGRILSILPRSSELIRPAVANADQVLLILAAVSPKPDLNLLDRYLVMMEAQGIRAGICFNKIDQAGGDQVARLAEAYLRAGYRVLKTSAVTGEGLEELKALLTGRTTVIAGPSGVGKSSLTNLLQNRIHMETGDISERIGRGRHTTRRSELILLDERSFLVDTPGFTSLDLPGMDKGELSACFPEFAPWEAGCRFSGCAHMKEPDCAVKQAVLGGEVDGRRYLSYQAMYEELADRRKY